MTRRWLLQLGGGVVLAGWSGVDLEAAALPPGVFDPSREHLGHVLAGHPVLPGGETELSQERAASFQGAFFSRDEYQTLLQVIAVMLGETPETPVVREIAGWIDLSVSEAEGVRSAALALSHPHRTLAVRFSGMEAVRKLEESNAPSISREGLAWLDAESLRKHQRRFHRLENPEQVAIVESLSEIRPDRGVNAGTRFFAYLKERVISGFYTSRVGLEELAYKGNAFYAISPGCQHPHA